MKRRWLFAVGAASAGLLVLQACSDGGGDDDAGTDAQADGAKNDVTNDTVNDVPIDVPKDVPDDVSDGAPACPASWMVVPDSGLVPDGGLPPLLIHAAASGTQNYTCEGQLGDSGVTTYAWVFVGPTATLDDCNAQLIGHHFASEAGAAAPEWQTLDQSFVIAAKAAAYTDDAGSVPWLLLKETSNGGSGTISKTTYIQRLYTNGGIAPTTTCDAQNVNTTMNVAYTAAYYFYGQ